jgi:hypothetical protein
MAVDGVRALVFDTFGTVVDWYSGLAREAGPFLARHGKPDVDPGDFAYAWRRLEQPAMEEVRSGRRPSSGWTFCTGRSSAPQWPSSVSTPGASLRPNSMR